MSRPRSASSLVLVAVALVLVAAVALRWAARRQAARSAGVTHVAAAPSPHASADAPGRLADAAPAVESGGDGWAPGDPFGSGEGERNTWAAVDLAEIQRALPDNIYWKMAAPTKDPEVVRQREEERARWNVEYGKVLSNTATDEEIDKFYAEKQRLSEDYLEFIVYLGTHYGDALSPRDIAALKLAGEMHHERLEEIPRKIREAHERHAAHETARQAWLQQQQQFEDVPPAQ